MALPGKHNVGGLWPAFWLLGNLARHTYVGSSEHIWPWSSPSKCNEQFQSAQLISACDRIQHYGLHKGIGRGAPEIDIFEVQPGNIKANTGEFLKMSVGQPFMSTSYQVAPGLVPPGKGWWPAPGQWYDNLTGGVNTSLNIVFYGTYNHFRDDTNPAEQDYWSDALSFNRQLNESHFGQFHKYRLEWDVPEEANEGNNYTERLGYIRWFLDDEFVMEVKGEGLNATGTGAEISSEPMYLLMNTAISSQWGEFLLFVSRLRFKQDAVVSELNEFFALINHNLLLFLAFLSTGFPSQCPASCSCKTFNCNGGYSEKCGFSEGFCDMINKPVEYKVNYVRVYQDPNDPKQKVGCSTPERPTRKFIEAHEEKYMQEGDEHPLKTIKTGGGMCSPAFMPNETLPQNCGGETRGMCDLSKYPPTCSCQTDWTGPYCLNRDGSDDVDWDPEETLADLGFRGPDFKGAMGTMLLIAAIAFASILVVPIVISNSKRSRQKGYSRVPDYEKLVGV